MGSVGEQETIGRRAALALGDGRTVLIRDVTESDADALEAFAAPPSFHLLRGHEALLDGGCGRCAERRSEQQPAIVATTPEGRIVGCAWLDAEEGQGEAVLRLAIEPHYRHLGVEANLTRELADDARERGLTNLVACIQHYSADMLTSLRAAGLQVASCFSTGGTAEITVDLTRAPGPPKAAAGSGGMV